MSEEEKMAKLELNRFIYGKQLSKDDIVDYLSILFNLIDNQQKEIERLKFDSHMIGKWNEYLDKECISKDKIREKIEKAKEINWHTPKLVIEYFEELLEEN